MMWTLSVLLPLMIGEYVPEHNENWHHFLELLDIMEYVLSPTVVRDTPGYIAVTIKSNLTTYKRLYPDSSYLPKMHYMVHIAQYLDM